MSEFQSLRRTVAAANAGNATLAKMHLQKAAEEAPDDAGVWLWMAWFADSPLNATHCLELALHDQRYGELAQAGLNWARAMAAFKVAEVNEVATFAVTPTVAAASAVVASQPAVEVEQELAANVAEVVAEIASTVAPTVPAVADELGEPSEMPAVVAESVEVPAATESGSSGAWDTVAPQSGEPDVPVVENASPSTPPVVASTEWFSASRAFPSGSTRASLWGGLGSSIELGTPAVADAAVTSPAPVVEQSTLKSDWDHSWQTGPRVEAPPTTLPESTSVAATPADETTLTAPVSVSEPVSVATSSASPTSSASVSSADPQPTIWRAAKTDWFGAEAVSRPEPVMPVATTRLADSIFAPRSAVSTEHVVAPAEHPMPLRVAEPATAAEYDGGVSDVDDDGGHGEFLEDQLADGTADELNELDNVVEAVDAEIVATTTTHTVQPAHNSFSTKAGKTVLVVDDSPTVRKLVAMTLEKRGFTVVSAFDGVAAIKEIATHNPDLILMDVTMPRLDGYQLCKLVKKHEATRHIPVIMLSGKDGMFDRLRGRLVGCSGYISKPFVPEALVETVEEQLRVMSS